MRPTTSLFIITTFVALAPSMAAPVPSESQTLDARGLASNLASKVVAKVSPKAAAFVKSTLPKLRSKVSPILGRIGVSMSPSFRSPLSPGLRSAVSNVGRKAQAFLKRPNSPSMFKQAKASRKTVANRAAGRKAAAARPIMARALTKTAPFKSTYGIGKIKTFPSGRKVMGAARQATRKQYTTPGSATTPKFKSTYGIGASKTFPNGQKVMGAARQARPRQRAQSPSAMSRLARVAHAVAPIARNAAQKASEFMHAAVEPTEV